MKSGKYLILFMACLLIFACNPEKKLYKQNSITLQGKWDLQNIEFENQTVDNTGLMGEMTSSLFRNSMLKLGSTGNCAIQLPDYNSDGIWQLSPDSKVLTMQYQNNKWICELSEMTVNKLVFNTLYNNKKAKFYFVKK